MPYQIGTASSFANLQSIIETFLTGAPGYSLASGVLSKTGTKIHVEFSNKTTELMLEIGKDSSGGLLHKHPLFFFGTEPLVGMGDNYFNNTSIVWPINYELFYFSTPQEMFRCVIEYNNGYTQNIGFGEIDKSVAMDGGVYIDGSGTYRTASTLFGPTAIAGFEPIYMTCSGSANYLHANALPLGFGRHTNQSAHSSSTILWAEFMGLDWWRACDFNVNEDSYTGTKYERARVSASASAFDGLRTTQHSSKEFENALQAHNANTVLVPIRLYAHVPDDTYRPLGKINDIRYANIKNLDFGQIINDGTDKWKCYPAFFKNELSLNGSLNDSGQLGYAVRYDGP